jgi:hypothetical protein
MNPVVLEHLKQIKDRSSMLAVVSGAMDLLAAEYKQQITGAAICSMTAEDEQWAQLLAEAGAVKALLALHSNRPIIVGCSLALFQLSQQGYSEQLLQQGAAPALADLLRSYVEPCAAGAATAACQQQWQARGSSGAGIYSIRAARRSISTSTSSTSATGSRHCSGARSSLVCCAVPGSHGCVRD